MGKRADRSPPPAFLFINRDATTIKSSGKHLKLDRIIQSHVQRSARRKILEEREKQSTTTSKENSTTAIDSRVDAPTPTHSSDDDDSPRKNTHLIPNTTRARDQSTGANNADSMLVRDPVVRLPTPKDVGLSKHTHIPTPPSSRTSPCREPTEIGENFLKNEMLQKYAPALLQYWASTLLSERFYQDARCAPLRHTRHADAIKQELQDAMSRPSHLYSLLASVSMQALLRDGKLDLPDLSADDEGRLVLSLKSKALEAIRRELEAGNINHALARDVQRLTCTAYLSDMPDNALTHFEAMMSVVESLDGLRSFDNYFIESEAITHWHGSLRSLQKPAINIWKSIAEPAELDKLRASRSIAEGGTAGFRLQSMLHSGAISHGCASAVDELHSVLDFTSWIELQDTYNTTHARWATLQHLSIGYRLLNLHGISFLDEAFRIAAVYFVALTRSSSLDQRVASASIFKLHEVMDLALPSLEERDSPNQAAFLWIAVVGGLTAYGTAEEAWFGELAAQTAPKTRAISVKKLEKVLHSIIWDSSLLEDALRRFWTVYMFDTT
jgi:hypothetical protein